MKRLLAVSFFLMASQVIAQAPSLIEFRVTGNKITLEDELGREIYDSYVKNKSGLENLETMCVKMGANSFESCPGLGITALKILNDAVNSYNSMIGDSSRNNSVELRLDYSANQSESNSQLQQEKERRRNEVRNIERAVANDVADERIYSEKQRIYSTLKTFKFTVGNSEVFEIEVVTDDAGITVAAYEIDKYSRAEINESHYFYSTFLKGMNAQRNLFPAMQKQLVECVEVLDSTCQMLQNTRQEFAHNVTKTLEEGLALLADKISRLKSQVKDFDDDVLVVTENLKNVGSQFDFYYFFYYSLQSHCGYQDGLFNTLGEKFESRESDVAPFIRRMLEKRDVLVSSWENLRAEKAHLYTDSPYLKSKAWTIGANDVNGWFDARRSRGMDESALKAPKDKATCDEWEELTDKWLNDDSVFEQWR